MYIAEIQRQDGTIMTLPMHEEMFADHVRLSLAKTEVPEDFENIRLLNGYFDAKAGDAGYYVAPCYHYGTFLTYFTERENAEIMWDSAYLAFCGKKNETDAQLVILDGMRHGIEFAIELKDGHYAMTPVIRRCESELYEDISVELYTLTGADANYSGMARCYRNYQLTHGACRTLKEKAAERPILDELAHVPELRIRLAWKPAPSPVPDQTRENEPPMDVACTFAQVEQLVAEMKRQGIKGAEICLIGWNVKGHDGRYPEIFPVEPELGGEEALRHLIKVTQEAGYRIVCHTNSSDAYRISEDWSDAIIMKDKDQKLLDRRSYSGGMMYDMCPVYGEKFAHRDLPKVRDLGFEGAHYIDVLSTVAPRQCWDPEHPLNKKECAEIWNRTLAYAQDLFGAVASEGTFDYTAGVLDFGLYSIPNLLGKLPALADERVPVWSLVYHGIMLYNVSSETMLLPILGKAAQVKFYEYGSRPALYFNRKFYNKPEWRKETDLRLDSPEECAHSVGLLKKIMNDYDPIADLQYEFMENHEKIADGVYRVTYSDGSRMLCNYNTEPVYCDGVTVPAEDFRVLRK